MPKSTKRVHDSFMARANQLAQTRLKMQGLLSSGAIDSRDIEQVYTGLFIDIFTEFETSIESLFLGLISGTLRSTNYPTRCKAKIRPASMTRQVIFGFRPYVDWLPYKDRTITRAKHYLDDGKPFTNLNDNQTSNLGDYCTIRNAIAHKSEAAYSKFQDLINGLALLPNEKTPGGYLKSIPNPAANQTQYEILVLELSAILLALC